MSGNPNIRLAVDATNPGQFFACCGLLELADRLWIGTDGWFGRREFCILTPDRAHTLTDLLSEARLMTFDVGADSETDDTDATTDDAPLTPLRLQSQHGTIAILLNWWVEKALKPWAGSMNERVILRAMLDAIDPLHPDPFNDLRAVDYKTPQMKTPAKKEPFYFDPRRGNKSHPLDSGFSSDTHKMRIECCPSLEALCFIGLQRARPAPTGTANQSRYTVWTQRIAANVVGAIVSGIVQLPSSLHYHFDNYFRTDQRKHKAFSKATLERSTNV